jgi:hypothetical protein
MVEQGEEALMSKLPTAEVNSVTPNIVISQTIEQAVEDTTQLITVNKQLVEAQLIADETWAKIYIEALEEGRVGTSIELDIRRPSFMRTIGIETGLVAAEEARSYYDLITQPTLTEQMLDKQYQLTPLQRQQLEVDREVSRQQFDPLLTVEELEIPEIALRLVDFQAMCALEARLAELYPIQFHSIIGQLVELCENKISKLQTMVGYEALQKHMLQIYVPYFSCFPYSLNILAMRITAATMQALAHKAITLYEMGAYSIQMTKPTLGIVVVENRTLETKVVLSGKPLSDAVPTKNAIYATEDITDEDEVPLAKDNLGHPYFWMMLRYAFSMPYYLRRLLAIATGMPENYKYGLYFGIGGLPSRYSTWKQKFLHVPEAKLMKYSADKTVMDLIKKYNAKKGFFYRRYGRYYNKRRV